MPTIWLEHHTISEEKSHYDHTDSFTSRNDGPKSSMALRLLVDWRKEHCTSIEGTRPSYKQQGDVAVVASPRTMPLESFHGEWHAQMATLTFTYLCNQAFQVFPTPDLQWLNCDKNISPFYKNNNILTTLIVSLDLKNDALALKTTRPSKKQRKVNTSNPKSCHRETHLCIDGGGTWSLPVIKSRVHLHDSPEDTKPLGVLENGILGLLHLS
jgi:hypothetical protein